MDAEKFEQGGVAQVFFDVGVLGQIFSVNLGNRQSVATKMPGEFQECEVLFPDRILNSNGAERTAGEAHDGPPGAAELALKRPYLLRQMMKMLLKQPL